MNKLVLGGFALLLAFTTGCNSQSTSGGPGTNKNTSKSGYGQGAETFSLSTPSLATHLKQGEAKDVNISIKRGKNFDEDVSLKFEGVPKGISILPAPVMIKHSDKDVTIKIQAADDAAIGDHVITVIGHPTKGTDAASKLEVKVSKK